MKPIKLIEILILLCASNFVSGQTRYADCNIHKVYSYNKQYFARTIPNEDTQHAKIGSTIVYKADSTQLYRIPRYFQCGYYDQQLFISNDGRMVACVINGDPGFYDSERECISLYKDGRSFKAFNLHDLIACNAKYHNECKLFYTPDTTKIALQLKEQLKRRSIYQSNDTLLIFCKMGQILKLDLSTGGFTKDNLSTFDTRVLSRYDTIRTQSYKLKLSALKGFPPMANGDNTEKKLADCLGMRVLNGRNSKKYKTCNLSISVHVDIEGNAQVVDVTDYGYNKVPVDEAKVYSFFAQNKFSTKNIPIGVDGWEFRRTVLLVNKNLKEAEREKREELETQRQKHEQYVEQKKQADRKRIEECSKVLDIELNKEIKQEDVAMLENVKSVDDKSICHFKYPNDTAFNVNYLNEYKDLYKEFSVSDSLDKQLNFELRLWVSGMYRTEGLCRLTYGRNGKWNAEKYIEKYVDGKRKVLYTKINLRENWDKIWDRLLLNNVLTVPDNPKFKGKKRVVNGDTISSEIVITDGTSYRVELLSAQNNRKYSISNPIGYYKFYTDSKPLRDFNRILEMLSAVFDHAFE